MIHSFFTQSYFPIHFRALGWGFAVLAVVTLTTNAIVSVVLAILAFVLLSTHYRLLVDTEKKLYQDCTWFVGFKIGKKESYDTIEYLFVNSGKFSQQYGNVAVRSHASGATFKGFIKFSEDNKVLLFRSKSKAATLKKMSHIARDLGVELNDVTIG